MEDFGIKDFYDVTLKAVDDIKINDKLYEPNETILRFGNIQLAGLSTSRKIIQSTGGKGNTSLVRWQTTQPLQLQIQKGVINKKGLSILTDSKLITKEKILVPITKIFNINIGMTDYIIDKNLCNINEPFFLYLDNGEKLNYKEDYELIEEVDKTIIKIKKDIIKSSQLIFDYYTNKINGSILRVGENHIDGFLKLEGKTRVKDDIDGQLKTGIITIPKVRLVSDLSIRLGEEIEPMIYGFSLEGEPVGYRNNTYVYEFTFLDENIEADI